MAWNWRRVPILPTKKAIPANPLKMEDEYHCHFFHKSSGLEQWMAISFLSKQMIIVVALLIQNFQLFNLRILV